ncbi:MAG: VOC family protein [Actinomycetota bacterium]|jgi:catechol 2,3-dioxygenase-like lactoylglutathione lyase family enzyme|nr:VOC family protein [Actinomycetota bacterium]
MAITHIQLLSLPVSDQDRARDFYVDVLGFDLVRDDPTGPDARWVQVAPKGAQTSITLVTWFPTMPAGSVKGTVLETDDLDGDVAHLTAKPNLRPRG